MRIEEVKKSLPAGFMLQIILIQLRGQRADRRGSPQDGFERSSGHSKLLIEFHRPW